MSILIKGMDKETAARICAYAGVRMDDSDFVPVPPHGDLIDRDGAVRDLRMDYAYAAAKIVALQPTIIPADPPKEEA